MSIGNIGKDFRALFTLEPEIKTQALLMFVYNFVLLNTLYLLKPVRDSLFLEQVGAYNLPFVFMLTAIAVIPISIGYSRLSKRHSVGWVVSAITLFLAANLIVIWFFIEMSSAWLYYGFYIWVSIYSVLITSQFWLFANTIFNSVQSKKIFGFLSLGAIAGGFTGGELTAVFINQLALRPESLLLISAITMIVTIPMVWVILKNNSKKGALEIDKEDYSKVDESVSVNPLKEILSHNHLLLIVALIAVTVMVTTLIDYQFKTVAEAAFTTEAALTSFMGKFYGRVSLIALLIQLFIGTIFTKKYGVSGSLLLLPLALLISAGGMLLIPGLVAGTMSRGIDQTLKHSIDRTGRELLFVPLPRKLKNRVKVFIDLFVDHGAQGITGILLLGLTFGLNLNVQGISVVVIILLVAWVVIAKMAGNSYIDVYRNNLKRKIGRKWEKHNKSKRVPEKTSAETIRELLKSDHEEDILWAFEAIMSKDVQVNSDLLVDHVHHPDSKVRIKLLEMLRRKGRGDFVDEVIELVYDDNPDVRIEALRYVYQFYEGEVREKLEVGLHHEDARIRAVAIGLIAEDGEHSEYELITDELLREALSFEGDYAHELRKQAAKVLGVVYNYDRAHFIKQLLNNEHPSVVKQAIKSAGKTQDRRFVHDLLLLMGNGIYRKTVEKALKKYGSRIYGTMYDHMVDNYLPNSTRRYIPWLFSQTVTEDSWDILKMSLKFCSIPIRHGVIKAMVRMRKERDDLRVSDEIISQNVIREIGRYSKLVKAHEVHQKSRVPLTENANEILEYEVDQTFENIFRLLSLNNDINDIENAYKAIVGNDANLKANAIEFIENLISWDIRKVLIPILEAYNTGRIPDNNFNSSINSAEKAMHFFREICHPELEEELEHKGFSKISVSEEQRPDHVKIPLRSER
ncbi:Npt1/Npt2 family nucleotide transporter [Fodinibius sp. N2]|uniref:Npt1/Npt2 family nucleotide transporter n=1 Tax=Fodinibius alkaliphilus TaxID=3140241 RepID=UPI00315B24A5